MILRRLFIIFGLAATVGAFAGPKYPPSPKYSSSPPKTSSSDDAFLRANDAFRSGDVAKLQKAAAQVRAGYVLAPYLDYWRLKLRLEDSALDPEVRAFLQQQAGSYLADRLRGEW